MPVFLVWCSQAGLKLRSRLPTEKPSGLFARFSQILVPAMKAISRIRLQKDEGVALKQLLAIGIGGRNLQASSLSGFGATACEIPGWQQVKPPPPPSVAPMTVGHKWSHQIQIFALAFVLGAFYLGDLLLLSAFLEPVSSQLPFWEWKYLPQEFHPTQLYLAVVEDPGIIGQGLEEQ